MDIGLQSNAQRLDYLSKRLISPLQQIDNKANQLRQLQHRMNIGLQGILKSHQQRVLRLQNSLNQLNPHNVLARGYAMVQNSSGEMVKNSQQLKLGETVKITLHIGEADATIISHESNKSD